MEIAIKKKVEEADELPEDTGKEVEGADVVEEKRRLELENAEMKGRLSVLQEKKSDQPDQHAQAKTIVYADANNLDDETFEKKYRMPKHQAMATILDRENAVTRDESKRSIAEAEAKTEMAMKFGADFYRFKSQIEDSLSDLSEEARKDPKRVAKHMERQYLAIMAEAKPVSKSKPEDQRRKIAPDFEKPTVHADAAPKKEEDAGEIAENDRPLAKALGLHSEKERKEYLAMGDYVPMNLGNNKWFRDPAKGFETIAPTK